MKLDELRIQISNIDIIEFSFKNPKRDFPIHSPFRFDFEGALNVNAEEERVIVNSKYKIYFDNETECIANAEIACTYQIANLSRVISENENEILPKEFINMLNSISVSTCRGVLYTLFRGTKLHSVILPIINTSGSA